MLKKIFDNVFNSTYHQKIASLENFIAAIEEEAQICVKIKGKDMVVPAGKVLNVQCKVGVGFLEKETPMFQQLETELPEGISAVDSVVTIKKGIDNNFQVSVVNQTKHVLSCARTSMSELLSVSNQQYHYKSNSQLYLNLHQ